MKEELTQILETNDEKEIKDLIYTFRDKQVMLDSDIAVMFNVKTERINQQMKRNINRFPSDFCFQLTTSEFKNLTLQNARTSYGGRRSLPYVFTEQGIIALAGVLKSEVADQMCVKISRVFVKMRHALIEYAEPLKYISQIHGEVIEFKEYTIKKLDEAFDRIGKLEPKKEVLILDGQWFDAYKAIVRLIERAKVSIVLVDSYGDKTALEYLSHRNEGVHLTLYKGDRSKVKNLEIETFRKQYGELVVKPYNASHNRYLILDSEEVYDLGSSLNSAGGKIFTITKLEIKEVREVLIKLFG